MKNGRKPPHLRYGNYSPYHKKWDAYETEVDVEKKMLFWYIKFLFSLRLFSLNTVIIENDDDSIIH